MKMERILHPTDFSECAGHALGQAIDLAREYRARLDIVHVVTLHTEDPSNLGDRLDGVLREVEDRAHRRLEKVSSDLGDRRPDMSLSVIRNTSAFDGIVRTLEDVRSDFVIMGTHGYTGVRRLLLGSVAEKVLRHVQPPVLTLSPSAPAIPARGPLKILVPVDFSGSSRAAVDTARGWIIDRGGSLTLLHAVEPLHPIYFPGGIDSRLQLDPGLPDRSRALLAEWIDPTAAEILIREGPAAEEIVDTATSIGADLVIMGNRGLTGVQHVLLGSVADRVVRTAPVPVLTVR